MKYGKGRKSMSFFGAEQVRIPSDDLPVMIPSNDISAFSEDPSFY